MSKEEAIEWQNVKITSDTFKKSPAEKLALSIAKKKHKELMRSNLTKN